MCAAVPIVSPAVFTCVLVWVWLSTLLVCVMGTCHLALPGALHYGGRAYLIVVTFIQTMVPPPSCTCYTRAHQNHETDLSKACGPSRLHLWRGTLRRTGRHCGLIKVSLDPFQEVGTQLPLAVAFEVRGWSYRRTQHRPEHYRNTCRHVHVTSQPSLSLPPPFFFRSHENSVTSCLIWEHCMRRCTHLEEEQKEKQSKKKWNTSLSEVSVSF